MKRLRSLSLVMVGLLVIGLLTWATPAASADTPGVWKLTGSMATSRRHSQVYPLPDGRILVVGGTDTTGVDGAASIFYATAEIYDPATGTWTATGSLTTGGRVLHTATYAAGRKDSDHRRLERISGALFGGDLRPGYWHLQPHWFHDDGARESQASDVVRWAGLDYGRFRLQRNPDRLGRDL